MSLVDRCDAILALLDEGLRVAGAAPRSRHVGPAAVPVDPEAYWTGLDGRRPGAGGVRSPGTGHGPAVRPGRPIVAEGEAGGPDVAA